MLHDFGQGRYLDPLSIETVVVENDYSDHYVSAFAVIATMRTGTVYKWRFSYKDNHPVTYEQGRANRDAAEKRAVGYQLLIIKLIRELSEKRG